MTGTLTSSLTVSMSHIRHIRPETLETVVIRLEHWSQSPVITNHSLLRPDTIDQSQLWPRLWSHQLPTTMGGVGGEHGRTLINTLLQCHTVTSHHPATIFRKPHSRLTPSDHCTAASLSVTWWGRIRIYFHVLMSLWWESCCYSENDHQHQQQSMSEKHCAAAHECCNVQHQFVTSNTQRKW